MKLKMVKLEVMKLEVMKLKGCEISDLVRGCLALFLFCSLGNWCAAQTPLHEFFEDESVFDCDLFARDISSGDVDGDGVLDLAIASVCQVTVYSGVDQSEIRTLDLFVGTVGVADDIHANGDFNGDGYDDIYVKTSETRMPDVHLEQIRVYSGLDSSLLFQEDTLHGVGLGFTDSLSYAGDINADGFDDILVQVDGPSGGPFLGIVRAYSGMDGSVLHEWITNDNTFGNSILGLGDINGDQHDDVAIGNPGFGDLFPPLSGRIWVYSGKDFSLLYTIEGTEVAFPFISDGFPSNLSSVPDMNGDGIEEIVSQEPNDDSNGEDAGLVRVFSGRDGEELLRIAGAEPGFGFQDAIGVPDLSGDGFPDLVVSNRVWENEGRIWVFSGVDGQELYSFLHPSAEGARELCLESGSHGGLQRGRVRRLCR